jgi:nickel/cobalt exporter
MTDGRRWQALGAACLSLFVSAGTATAHPAGFTSINRYIGVECDGRGRIHLAYLLDFAEMPSYAEIDLLDADANGMVSPQEQRNYLDRRLPPLVDGWTVEIDGEKASLVVTGSSLEILEGERGLSTVRIAADIVAERPHPLETGVEDVRVRVEDLVFSDHPGWREIAARDSADATVTAGMKETPSEALSYGVGRSAPRVNDAEVVFHLAASALPSRPTLPWAPSLAIDPRIARLSAAMRNSSGSPWFSALAFVLALLLGAAHALAPGHGKALAAAYLVGRRARPCQALLFGLTLTAAHTVVVFVVGVLAVTVERTVGSDRLLRGIEVAAALTVLVLGLVLFSRRWREVVGGEGPEHVHGDGARGSVVALGISAGVSPCPTALAILLTAVAIHRFAFGLALVLAFSVGVTLTLTTTGLLVLVARRALNRAGVPAPLLRWLPLVSATCVLVIGALLCASACSPSRVE